MLAQNSLNKHDKAQRHNTKPMPKTILKRKRKRKQNDDPKQCLKRKRKRNMFNIHKINAKRKRTHPVLIAKRSLTLGRLKR